MRDMIITGRLGGDPVEKVTTKGTKYVQFRVANNEYSDRDAQGNDKTFWATVTVWNPSLQVFCKNLTKGSSVIIIGEYSNRGYMSNKTNSYETSNDITAHTISFNNTGKALEQGGEPVVKTADAVPQPDPIKVAEPKVTKPVKAAVQVVDTNDDELPF